MKEKSLGIIIWSSVSEAGLIAGFIATFLQLANLTGLIIALIFVTTLVILSVTILNIRLFLANKTYKPFLEFVNGHDEAFDLLTKYIKAAKESIWVTRFSKGSVIHEHDYFGWTSRRISGDSCKPILTYRRIMNIDTADKSELVCDLLEKFYANKNFFLRETEISFFFELLIIDSSDAFIMFHEPGSTGTINSALRISKPEIAAKLKEVYEAIWNHQKTKIIKEESVLSEGDRDKLVQLYSAQIDLTPISS